MRVTPSGRRPFILLLLRNKTIRQAFDPDPPPPPLYHCLLWPHPLFLSSSSKLLVAPGLRPPPTPTAHPSLTRCTHSCVCVRERERKRELLLSLSSHQTQKLFCFPLIACTRFFVPAAFLQSSKKRFPFLPRRLFLISLLVFNFSKNNQASRKDAEEVYLGHPDQENKSV